MFDAQLPLLKTAALYFDKLLLLYPRDATWNLVGPDPAALDEVLLLERHGLVERVSPTSVFEHYGSEFAEAVREDISDPEFIRLRDEPRSELASTYGRWLSPRSPTTSQ